MNIFNRLSLIGTTQIENPELSSKVVTTNIISIATIIVIQLFNLIVGILDFQWVSIIGLIGHSILLSSILFLNAAGKSKIARFMIPLASFYFTNFMAIAWGQDSIIEFTLIPILILPFMIYTQTEKIQKFTFLGLIILNWFTIKWIYASFNPLLFLKENIILIQSIIIFLAFSWTTLMLLSLAKGDQYQSE